MAQKRVSPARVKRSLALPAAYVRGHPASALDGRDSRAGWARRCARLLAQLLAAAGMRETDFCEITDQFAALWPPS